MSAEYWRRRPLNPAVVETVELRDIPAVGAPHLCFMLEQRSSAEVVMPEVYKPGLQGVRATGVQGRLEYAPYARKPVLAYAPAARPTADAGDRSLKVVDRHRTSDAW